MINEKFGIVVRNMRTETQEELAKKLGLSRTSIANIEAGTQGVSLKMAEKIAGILYFSLGEIEDLYKKFHKEELKINKDKIKKLKLRIKKLKAK